MSKATQQSAERCQDKRSSQKPAARRPAAQIQIRVYGLPAHFAGSGRDGPPTLILCGLVYVGRSASNRRPLSSLKKNLPHGTRKYRPFAKRPAIIRAWSEFHTPTGFFANRKRSVCPFRSGHSKAARQSLPRQQSETFLRRSEEICARSQFQPGRSCHDK